MKLDNIFNNYYKGLITTDEKNKLLEAYTKSEKIQNIWKKLQNGETIPIKTGKIWGRENKKYIFWQYYGQSANDNTLESLVWLLHIIFKEDIENVF